MTSIFSHDDAVGTTFAHDSDEFARIANTIWFAMALTKDHSPVTDEEIARLLNNHSTEASDENISRVRSELAKFEARAVAQRG